MDIGEKHRPDRLDRVAGQKKAVAAITKTIERNGLSGGCWWLHGASGTGKTTIARILAKMFADDHSTREFVGRDMSIDDARQMMDTIPMSSMFGGRAWVVNEAQDLSEAVLGLLLEIAEQIKRSKNDMLIFTSMTMPNMLDGKGAKYHALMTRCYQPEMASTEDPAFRSEVIDYVYGVAIEEEIPATMEQIALACERGKWSVRAALAALEMGLPEVVEVKKVAPKVERKKEIKGVRAVESAGKDPYLVKWNGRNARIVKTKLSDDEIQKERARLGDSAACWKSKRGWTLAQYCA